MSKRTRGAGRVEQEEGVLCIHPLWWALWLLSGDRVMVPDVTAALKVHSISLDALSMGHVEQQHRWHLHHTPRYHEHRCI